MKTIREAYNYNFRCDVYSDGTLYPSSAGLLYPDDAVWRVGAHIEFQKVTSAIFHIIYDYVESIKPVDKAEFETLYRFYPVFHQNGYATVVINNKPTVMKVGKLLRKSFSSLTDHQVRDLVDMITLREGVTTIDLTRNEEEILDAYTRVRSCMSGSELPLVYLQDKETYLAVVKQEGKIIGRAWTRNGERTAAYAFGLYKEKVIQALSCFSENSYFLEGVSFISHDRRFPYIDSCYGRVNYSDGVVTITPEGEFRISEEGYIIKS